MHAATAATLLEPFQQRRNLTVLLTVFANKLMEFCERIQQLAIQIDD
ncbi:hypothetical protein [Mesorhizobium sp.]|nr:hypothetical protein [Mesorhizobium sp.]